MLNPLVSLCTGLLLLAVSVSAPAQSWQPNREADARDQVSTWTREVPDSPVKAFRGVVEVPHGPVPVLAAITAGLVFLSLHLLMVRPLRRMSDNLVSFRRAPEDAATVMSRSRRRDEIGVAQRELRVMQQRVRAALRQKARLAAVGGAVSKINHDLRNMLAPALVVSDRLAMAENLETRKVSAPLLAALERAINLCTQTLSFAHAEEPDAQRGEFPLAPLVDEVALVLPKAQIDAIQWRNDVPHDLSLWADRDQV